MHTNTNTRYQIQYHTGRYSSATVAVPGAEMLSYGYPGTVCVLIEMLLIDFLGDYVEIDYCPRTQGELFVEQFSLYCRLRLLYG